MAKIIRFGEQVPSNKLIRPTDHKMVEGALTGDPDGWVLEVDDPEALAYALKYRGWGLLEPAELQCPFIPNADGHQTAADFKFTQISELELKLRVVAPDYQWRAKALREFKEKGGEIVLTDIPDIAKPFVKELNFDPAEWESYEKDVPVVENPGTAQEARVTRKAKRYRRRGELPPIPPPVSTPVPPPALEVDGIVLPPLVSENDPKPAAPLTKG